MRLLLLRTILLGLTLWLLGSAGAVAKPGVRILFIGNSYTFANNLPEMVEAMAPPGAHVQTRMVAEGGASLADHWANGTTRQIVRNGHWTFVVLQEQSSLGKSLYVDGLSRIGDPTQYVEVTRKWAAFIRAAGAKPVIFQFWPLRGASKRDWAALRYAHAAAARAAHAAMVPAGDAWMALRTRIGDNALYQEDGSHPTALGSYLAAATVSRVLLGARIERMPLRVAGHSISLDEKRREPISTIAEVTSQQRHWVAIAVRSALREHRRPSRPARIDLPRVGTGEPLALDRVIGDWRGSTTLFPRFFRFPAELRIRLRGAADGNLDFQFGGKPDNISRPISRATVKNDRLSFVATGGPNGSYFYFVGVRRGSKLTGVAEMVLPDGTLLAIGTWNATSCALDRALGAGSEPLVNIAGSEFRR